MTGIENNEVALGRDLGFAFSEPFVVQDMPWRLSASVGTAVYPADGGSFDQLMETADSRMYDCKGARKRRSEKWRAHAGGE